MMIRRAVPRSDNGNASSSVPLRKSRLRKRRKAPVPKQSFKSFVPAILILGFFAVFLALSVSFLHLLEVDDKQQQAHLPPKKPLWKSLRGHVQQRIRPNNKSDDEVIDMRQLTYELPFDNPDGGAWKQGWDVQPQTVDASHPLKVFVLPHSHCDPGWLKTFDDYFQSQTKAIITTVVDALLQDKRRKFIWAEISYFEWWWREQSAERQAQVRQLLQAKQLEFVTGGWVQPDEANSELYAMEIQLQEGHDWIRETFGSEHIPRYGWSIDPFGYSPTMAYLLQKYGFEGMLIQRVHYAVKKELAKRKHLEFYWRQTWDAAGEHDIFTHVMPFFSYDVPHTCGPDPSVCCQFDFKRTSCPWNKSPQVITDANLKERALLLLDQYQKKASLYRSNVVLVPLGDDFRYQTAEEAEAQYTNHQKIFDYLNANVPGVQVQFGTLSEYFQAVQGTFDPPILKGSFFTYSDVNEDYWSGYFTSRVFDKALDRQLERVLFAATQMGATKKEVQEPRRALSLFQHHDGVTGTAKTHVVEDYARRIHDAISTTQDWMVKYLQSRVQGVDVLKPCWMSNAPRGLSQNLCGDEGSVVVYNPLPTKQTCGAVDVPGKQFQTVKLPCEIPGRLPESKSKFVFDPDTGLMKEPIREEWKVWRVSHGGAYLFVPGQLLSYDISADNVVVEDGGYIVTTEHWKRSIVEKEVTTEFGTTATVVDFIYETNLRIDNQEWFARFTANIASNGVFHTDLNGFNFDTHRFRPDMPIQSQVFPMPTLASIEDDKSRMTVLSEHAQGTASLQDGSIDIWLDRRLKQDDNRGLFQGVQDNKPTRTRLRMVIEHEGYDTTGEFNVSPLGRRMWDELQHPLEMFGNHTVAMTLEEKPVDPEAFKQGIEERQEARKRKRQELARERLTRDIKDPLIDPRRLKDLKYRGEHKKATGFFESLFGSDFRGLFHPLSWHKDSGLVKPKRQSRGFGFQDGLDEWRAFDPKPREIVNKRYDVSTTSVPFVFMVYNRVNYLKKAINSLRSSDFPKERVPIIISHDGHVPEVVQYVQTLKEEFKVIQFFHPHSCYEHKDTFPGDDKKLNEGYSGDSYGNPRSGWATCCKHHFTWMLKTVFGLDFAEVRVDTFVFLEEDYVVAPTVYSAIVSGLNAMEQIEKETKGGFFGIGMDPTEADAKVEPFWYDGDSWYADIFHSGPMSMNREVFAKLQAHAEDYCKFDDYNWDWSLVHVQGQEYLPHTLLMPSRSLARHIGIKEGMHVDQASKVGANFGGLFPEFSTHREELDTHFVGTKFGGNPVVELETHNAGYGGWGHPADHGHCMKVLRP